jgi:protocatechuate 3,4-dioxygenase beta subunit
MDNDDKQVGQILNRRDVLKILGLGSAATLLVACAPDVAETLSPTIEPTQIIPATETILQEATSVTNIPVCVVRPELTEGPYFSDGMLNRSDIRQDTSDGSISQGAPFDLAFNVTQVNGNGCTPLASAQVDIWHCDATGVYSDAVDRSFNTVGKTFLRGYQVTDANGVAKFVTIYPGWYPGRAVHIHFKIRINNYEFTSQLFFDDTFSDGVFSQAPYISGNRTLNSQDGIFGNSGNLLGLAVTPNETGYAATFDIGVQI